MSFRSLAKGTKGLMLALSCTLAQAAPDYTVETLAKGLNNPWSIAALPDGSFLVTEKPGRLQRLEANGDLSPINGVPPVHYASQGGLLDVISHPAYPDNGLIFLSYAAGNAGANRTTVARARLVEDTLEDLQVILEVTPDKATSAHYGGKLAFARDGTLLVSVGEGFQYREKAQGFDTEFGKLLRINEDGTVPQDNPLRRDAPRVYSFGHRNPQGLAVDRLTGDIYMHEHGPKGGDELNLIRPGLNYGWPAITYGMDYSGAIISPFTEAAGMEQPLAYWVPSIGPSGMAIYHGNQFPAWEGDILVGSLIDKNVRRIDLHDGKVAGQEAVFPEINERVRDVRVFEDGAVYLTTDEGQVYRISAK